MKIMIARLLLLYFVVAVIPLDLYHKHHYPSREVGVQTFNPDKGLAQSIFTNHCLICDLHLDRQAYQNIIPFLLTVYETTLSVIGFHDQQALHAGLSLCFNLRGPPLGMEIYTG